MARNSDKPNPSPFSTGGGGTFFEQHVGAYWLAQLLVRGVPPILINSVVSEVHFQTERLGWETDDFLVVCEHAGSGVQNLAIQAKSSFVVSAADDNCRRAIADFWKDFKTADPYSPLHDCFALVTSRGTDTLLRDFVGLLDCARMARDDAEFAARLATSGLVSRKAVHYCEQLQKIIADIEKKAVSVAEMWPFLRVIHVLSLDLHTSTRQTEAQIKTLLAQTVTEGEQLVVADETWNALLSVASKAMPQAGSLRRDDLPSELRERHAPLGIADQSGLREIGERTGPIPRGTCSTTGPRSPLDAEIFCRHILRSSFTGRTRQSLELTQWWLGSSEPIRVLVGIGGMGKSSLAWVWMHEDVLGIPIPDQLPGAEGTTERHARRVPDNERPDGVLWWSFYSPELDIRNSVFTFVDRALQYVSRGEARLDNPASLDHAIDALLGYLRTGRFLLVLDGFERALRLYNRLSAPYESDVTESDPNGDLRRCLDDRTGRLLREAAFCGRSRILLTSREFPKELDNVAGASRRDLATLDSRDSLRLFRAAGVEGSDEEVLQACDMAGHHPLALRILIGRITETPGEHRGHINAIHGYSVATDLRLEERRQHVFEIGYGGLDAMEKDLFGRMAIFTQPVGYAALRVCSPYGGNAERLATALKSLEQRNFLIFDRECGEYDMHPLVRQYAYSHLSSAERRDGAREAYGYLAERLAQHETGLSTLSLTIEVYRQALRAGLLPEARSIYVHRLFRILFFELGRFEDQATLLREFVDAARDILIDPVDHAFGSTLINLSTAYNLLSRPREAFDCAVEGARLLETLDTHQQFVANRLVYIACSEVRLGDLRSATRRLEESVERFSQSGDRFREAIARGHLAWALYHQGDFENSERHLDEAAIVFVGPRLLHWRCIVEVHRARRFLLLADGKRALKHAREAYKLARESGHESNVMRSEWVMGAALLQCARDDVPARETRLAEAEVHLRSALHDCNWSRYRDLQVDVHLTLAELFAEFGNPDSARQQVGEALGFAGPGGYRLKESDAHNLLARFSEQDRSYADAREHALEAERLALCDGPPFWNHAVVSESRARLNRLKTVIG